MKPIHLKQIKRWLRKQRGKGWNKQRKLQSDNCLSKSSLKALDRRQRGELFISGYGYLRQDLDKGVNSNVLALKVTNPDKINMPYEHLTYKRIDILLH